MLHHHFPQLISPFHDRFVSGRNIAQLVRVNPATNAITTYQAAPLAPTFRGRDILTSILIHDPIARIRASFERWQEYDLLGPERPGARFQMLHRAAPQNDVERGPQFSVAFLSTGLHDERTAIPCPRATRDDYCARRRRHRRNCGHCDEWLALAQSFFTIRFEGISLAVSHHTLINERHRYGSQASLGQVPGPREQPLPEC